MVHMTCRLYNIYCTDVHSHSILLITLFMGLCNNYKKIFSSCLYPFTSRYLTLQVSLPLKKISIFEEKKIPNLFSYRIACILDLGYDAI